MPKRSTISEIIECTLRNRCGRAGNWYLAEGFSSIADEMAQDIGDKWKISGIKWFDREYLIDMIEDKINGFELLTTQIHPNFLLEYHGRS